jgi:hypothetical protein
LVAAEAEREKSGTGTPIFFDHVAGDAMGNELVNNYGAKRWKAFSEPNATSRQLVSQDVFQKLFRRQKRPVERRAVSSRARRGAVKKLAGPAAAPT